MAWLRRIRRILWREFRENLDILLFMLVSWQVLKNLEVYEWFYGYSRAHEDWELDEIFVLAVNMTLALSVSLIRKNLRLYRTVRERELERWRANRNARHDPLTGLINRRTFEAMLRQAEQERGAPRRVVAILDLDRFKPVNDLHGHAAGDHVLRRVAERLRRVLAADGTPARLGGDEFAVLFGAGVAPERAERLARRILAEMEEPVEFHGVTLMVGASLGLTCVGRKNLESGLLQADKALYAAKRDGRGRFAWYDTELDRRSTERARIEADLRIALRDDTILPHFQPIYDLAEMRLSGFEALARWSLPGRGEVPPTVFVEIAEDCGLIGQLGWSILRQSCRAALSWDPSLTLSVNFSPTQFHDRGMVDRIAAVLEETGFPASRLVLELTEGAVIRDMEAARRDLERLRALGITLALDDFGTGYSSLTSLQQLSFDRLKIDRSFVTGIASHPSDQKVLTAVIALAQGLELAVTAEGIETPEDLEFVRALGCEHGQGYHLSEALSAEEVRWNLETRWGPPGAGEGAVPRRGSAAG